MNELKDEIEEARVRVAHFRGKAERPGSRLEDDYALEKARTRLLTLELRLMKQMQGKGATDPKPKLSKQGQTHSLGRASEIRAHRNHAIRTKSEQKLSLPRRKAEEAFAILAEKGSRKPSETAREEGQ